MDISDKKNCIIVLLVLEIFQCFTGTVAAPNIVCFYGYNADLPPEKLNAFYCTHIITYGSITSNYTIAGDTTVYSRIIALRKQNPDLKVLLCLGANGKDTPLSQIVHSPELTESFITLAIEFLTEIGFDGLDFDWEFPAWGGDPPDSRMLFPTFLKKFMEAFGNFSEENGEPRLLLTADVAAPLTIMFASYDIPEMAKYVDFVNIMCYDFHFYIYYDPITGHNAPLFNRSDEILIWATMNTAWAASEWNARGMPKSKINVGIPTYGHTWALQNSSCHDVHSQATGPGSNEGWIDYPQVCTLLQSGGTSEFDEESKVPYAYKDDNWISYDDVRSFTYKVQYILNEGYAGTMVFSYNSDDYAAVCDGQTRFPLIATVYNLTKNYIEE
ncbi:Glyco_18 [Chamberlinius hualienensis]